MEELFTVLLSTFSPPATLQINAAKNVVLESVHVSWSDGYGLLTLNMMGYCSIVHCMFTFNGWKRYPQDGGNAYFVYQQNDIFPNATESTLAISHTVINGGADMDMMNSRGVKIVVRYIIVQYQLSIILNNCSFHNSNSANMRMALFGPMPMLSLTLHVMNTVFRKGQAQTDGGGLCLISTNVCKEHWCTPVQDDYSQVWIIISNSSFIGNKGGGLYSSITAMLYSLKILNSFFITNIAYGTKIISSNGRNDNLTLFLQNSTFIENVVNHGHGMFSILHFDTIFHHSTIVIIGCHFKTNKANYLSQKSGIVFLNLRKVHAYLSIYDSHWYNNSGSQLMIILKRQAKVFVTDCTFQYGYNNGRAIHIRVLIFGKVDKSMDIRHQIFINKTVFKDNSAPSGSGIYIKNAQLTQTHITGCVFRRNIALEMGGAILIKIRLKPLMIMKESLPSFLVINHTSISENPVDCAGIYIDIRGIDVLVSLIAMEIYSSQFEHNEGASIAVYNKRFSSNYGSEITVFISNSQFYENLATKQELNDNDVGIIDVTESAIKNIMFTVDYFQTKLVITETDFTGNRGSCIKLNGSLLSLKSKVSFTNNTAYAGAAILLDCSDSNHPSYLNLYQNSTVIITNNTAQRYGGGIAVNPACYHMSQCFYHAPYWNQTWPCTVHMEGNSARTAGNSIYGPSVDSCEPQLLHIFNIVEGYSASEVVLFEHYSICFCIEDHMNQMEYELEQSKDVRPGQEITVQANICTRPFSDNNNYAIRAEILQSQTALLGKRQEIQIVTKPCDNLTYSVVTDEKKVLIRLFHDTITRTQQTLLKLTILPCPLGFKLDSSLKCDCADYLLLSVPGITCITTTNLINVPAGVWIGNYTDGNLVAHLNCPLDYCNAQPHSINLQQQDFQCSNNHSGVLCGACKTGLSLTLGTARCVDYCSNYYLFIIIPIVLAGVLLVLLLLKCNLTASVGTTNALIFYANIVHINRAVFFPQNNVTVLTRFLAVFIAWLNLDLGINTCFYAGMTAYANSWMQFLFPIYIWMLVIVIIYTSRYSITVSKLIGRNAVPLLATLFLLSYAKLLRTVIAVVSPITIHDESGNTHVVWLMDGNVPFLRGKHAALFAMALLTVLLYILPFTLLTLLAPLLQARTHHPLLRWVVRIKPLLDAYQGPYKNKYRHWTGVMLVMRLILFTVFAGNILGDSKINLFSITLAVILYQMCTTSASKNYFNIILECFYSLNISVYALTTLLLKAKQRDTEYLTWVMVGSALAMFCSIIIWHFYSMIHNTLSKLKVFLVNICRRRPLDCGDTMTHYPTRQPVPTTSVIDMSELREPLLTMN